ncbi:hypothetical protein VTO42DRAFT_444 [Malbranchea cinnamomea]
MESFYHPDAGHHGTSNSGKGYFLQEDLSRFDAAFFNISPDEAGSMDPQQRLLLETVYEALDRAGLRLDLLQGSATGVFCGHMNEDYTRILTTDMEALPPYVSTGNANSIVSNRVSYFFDWHGPSITLDTACSSSLVALHLAVESLHKRDCSLAVAAGSNLMFGPEPFILSSKMQMLSPTGRSRMWDEQADGYARGEGVAAVILKRLSDAVRDGDRIECLVRATGVNSDGRTMGITMPSSKAQEQLIRATYQHAGLNPDDPKDRCQYFEAHGTGTAAGDPKEAAAIYNSFFQNPRTEDDILYVGSIKTIIGHTEATSGIAGVIRASLALQNKVIPPNLHFNAWNPDIAQFASHLRVPVSVLPWPELPPGTPRRASVNSFGFGGTNAHAILESFDQPALDPRAHPVSSPPVLPFVFSAASEASLGSVLEQYLQWLQDRPEIDLLDLASSLMMRRSALSHRVWLTATSVDNLRENIQEELKRRRATNESTIVWRLSSAPKKVLGVFTGQGAQWAQMGLDLILNCPKAKMWLDELQRSLDGLPREWRPDFSLFDELSAPESSSRLHTSTISLTLRTAMQIIQVNLLNSLGITFSAVIGHSSGEIAAAYAAGALSASDAIRAAYLRGIATTEAGANKKRGGMLAVGISWDQAQALLEEAPYAGNVTVAAHNSPSNITLSGDADLIEELGWLLKSLDHSPRLIRVDTAYHSHHMKPCAEPYMRALRACQIQAKPPSVKWFSSVYGGQPVEDVDSLSAEYWKENMLRPVMFSQAMTSAIKYVPDVDLIVEVGPQPALKGPALQTLSTVHPTNADVPYVGLSVRDSSSIEALATAIGAFWTYLGPKNIDIAQYVSLFNPFKRLSFVTDLPTYPFDHTKSYWSQSRISRARHNRQPPNPLLGVSCTEIGVGEYRWRNYLHREELEWLEGHQIQAQTVFPATGYVVMALEAAATVAGGRSMSLLEIRNFTIDRALTIPDDAKGVETLFKFEQTRVDNGSITGAFNCLANADGSLKSCASGQMTITLGEQEAELLPSRFAANDALQPVDATEFYRQLQELGYGYSGLFKGLTDISRRKDVARGTVHVTDEENSKHSLLFHPATMDSSLHALFAAIGAPGDGQINTLHLPTRIDRTTINPAFCRNGTAGLANTLTVDAALTSIGNGPIRGDIDIFDSYGRGVLQVEGIHISPLITSPEHNPHRFSLVSWGLLQPDAAKATSIGTPDFFSYLAVENRIALLYLRDASKQLSAADRKNMDWHRSRYTAWMDLVLTAVREGKHPHLGPECLKAEIEEVSPIARDDPSLVDIFIIHVVGKHLLAFLRGETVIMETLRNDNLLARVYKESHTLKVMTRNLGTLVDQIAFRYPRMKILEIGAGTGSATHEVLKRIGRNYHSYTYTDISPVFFEEAQNQFAQHEDRFVYKVLDIESDPVKQGFAMHEYDMVIASNVLHATQSLTQTLIHTRKLLKPGGWLVVLESTLPDSLYPAFVFGTFKGWWHGENDSRPFGPTVNGEIWDELLRSTGFGGFETVSPKEEADLFGTSVFVSQAVDDRIDLLRDPLRLPSPVKYSDLFLVGGATQATSNLILALGELLNPYFHRIVTVRDFESFSAPEDSSLAAVLTLSDIDWPCLHDLTESRLKGLQKLATVAGKLLWVATGREGDNPYITMTKGLIQTIAFENPHCLVQHLTIADSTAMTSDLLATTLMRLVHTNFDNNYNLPSHVVSTEKELLLEDGVMKIPRLRPDAAMNQRLLASRGVATDYVDVQQTPVRVIAPAQGHSGFSLKSIPQLQRIQIRDADTLDPSVHIRVHHSTLGALRVDGVGFIHLVVGQDEKTRRRKLALSLDHASLISTPSSWCWDIPDVVADSQEPEYLNSISAAFLAVYLVNKTRCGMTLLIHDPDAFSSALRVAVSTLASLRKVRVLFTTSNKALAHDQDLLFVHPQLSPRALSRLLPSDVSVSAGFGEEAHGIYSRIQSCLPDGVDRYDISDLYRPGAFLTRQGGNSPVTDTIATACLVAIQNSGKRQGTAPIKLQDLPGHTSNGLEIIDWTHPEPVFAQIQSASSQVTLSADKTYLLVGMTGDLGRSVCQWMITRGARYVVLTSRSPKVDQWWIDEMASLGARVLPLAMDVTDRESVLSLDNFIRKELPPVGGVVNGAAVLNDMLFVNTPLEVMQQTLRPKVEGSLFLDELYRDVEFFIFFGSFSGLIGNFNQAAYSAANAFMMGLVHRRRRQKLPASIINPAEIRGIGYVHHMGKDLSNLMADTLGMMFVSERDLHELFAEGILASPHDSGRDPDITCGPRQTDPVQRPNVLWFRTPKIWHFVGYCLQSNVQTSKNQAAPVKEQLESATNISEAADIIATSFIAKIRRKLNFSEDFEITGKFLLSELGVNSLVAVDLRIWFVKELGVDIPVLQLLGSCSIEQVAQDAAAKLDASLIPNVKQG